MDKDLDVLEDFLALYNLYKTKFTVGATLPTLIIGFVDFELPITKYMMGHPTCQKYTVEVRQWFERKATCLVFHSETHW